MKLRSALLIFSFVFMGYSQIMAQESMVNDISYVFLEKLIATAKENYPRIKTYKERTEMAKNNITKQTLTWFDPISFSYVYQPKTTLDIINPSFFNGYQIGIGINLATILQRPFNIKQAKQELTIARYDEQEYNLSLEAVIKQRYFSYLQQVNILKLQSKALADIEGVTSAAKLKYEKSEVTFEQYSQALQALSGAAQAKIQAEASLLSAKAALEELLVKRLEDIK